MPRLVYANFFSDLYVIYKEASHERKDKLRKLGAGKGAVHAVRRCRHSALPGAGRSDTAAPAGSDRHLRPALHPDTGHGRVHVSLPRDLLLWQGQYDGRCAKAFPQAQITAMDYWGAEWNYAKEQCEKNARLEGVANRITFQKGDAAHLSFDDETFDAAVSNFVFHEVHTAKDKRDVVREAFHIVKKGGVFSFQDMFSQKALYGDMDEFVRQLQVEGITEIHYIGNLEKKLDFIPGFVTTPWMISGMRILYGRK